MYFYASFFKMFKINVVVGWTVSYLYLQPNLQLNMIISFLFFLWESKFIVGAMLGTNIARSERGRCIGCLGWSTRAEITTGKEISLHPSVPSLAITFCTRSLSKNGLKLAKVTSLCDINGEFSLKNETTYI